MKLIYFSLFLAFHNLCYASSVDVTVIYRLNDPEVKIVNSSIVVPNAEAHIRTNALGLFQGAQFSENIFNENVQYNFPPCYAIRNNCTWSKHGWDLVSYSSPTGNISSNSYRCTAEENFECHQIQFYNLQKLGTVFIRNYGRYDSRDVHAYEYNYAAVIFDDPGLQYCEDIDVIISGRFYVPNYGHRIREIYSFSGYTYKKLVIVEGSYVNIKTRNSCPEPYSVSYYGGIGTTFALSEPSGHIESPYFLPFTRKLCIGVGYKVKNISIPDIQAMMMIGSFQRNMYKYDTFNYDDSLFYTRFLIDLTKEEENSQIKIKVTVEQETTTEAPGFFLNMIEKCSFGENIEKIIILNETYFPTNHSEVPKNRSDSACINGGTWPYNKTSCVCPAGFTGEFCEIGCGPNRYGNDCAGECSRFFDKCKGLLMCKYDLPCLCAPGFKGQFCNISCTPGEYGANCENKCNNCFNGTFCDLYTGYCSSGCEKGYRSPLCYYKYQYVDLPPEVTSPTFDTIAVTVLFSNVSGFGNAKYYQVQYKKENENFWSKGDITLIRNKLKSDIIDINGLKVGNWYNIRAVLIDKDLDSYHGEDIPYATIQTQCIIPDSVDYKLESYSISQQSFKISWKYDPDNATSCPLSKFNVYIKEQWRWLLYWNGSDNQVNINNLIPGETHFIKVRAVTINGPANSEILSVTTVESGPDIVTDLEVTQSEAARIGLKWQPPNYSAENIEYYIVKYQCKQLLGCPDEDCSDVNGNFKVILPHAVINGLLPHAQYIVSVVPMSIAEGPAVMRKMSTDEAAPNVAPEILQKQIHHRTNSSFTVSWKYPSDCKGLNGFFSHYEYDLVESVNEQGSYNSSILKGSTRNTSVTFKGLRPHSTYYVKVYVATSAGINLSYPLVIKSGTKAAVPGPVENLAVYKKGRKMVGLRWAAPTELHETLQSFTVSYKKRDSDAIYSSVLEPTHCPAWPHLYCHTVSSLIADNEYDFTVSARNSEIPEDGDQVSVHAFSREEAPGVPTNLEILSQTETSILIQWKLPHLLNGVLRSFFITIEETDSYNATNCCQDFPLKTLTVHQEKPHYTYQFTGLHSASTYTISVSAKTTVIGQAIVATGHTKPPVISINDNIEVLQDNSYHSGIRVKLFPVQQYVDLIRGYLLLVVPQNDILLPDTITEVQTKDEVLTNELLDIIDEPFYIAAEFQQNDVLNYPEIELGTGSSPVIEALSHIQDPYLTKGSKYKLALVLVLQYCGVYNLPHVFTPDITAN